MNYRREQVGCRRNSCVLYSACVWFGLRPADRLIGPVFCGFLAIGVRATGDSRLRPICCTLFPSIQSFSSVRVTDSVAY